MREEAQCLMVFTNEETKHPSQISEETLRKVYDKYTEAMCFKYKYAVSDVSQIDTKENFVVRINFIEEAN